MIWHIPQTVDLMQGYRRPKVWPYVLMLPGADSAHSWDIQVNDNGSAVDFTDYVAYADFERSDGERVHCSGTIAGNTVSVEFPSNCYTAAGTLHGIVTVEKVGVQVIPISELYFPVLPPLPDEVIDPESSIPSIYAIQVMTAAFAVCENYNEDRETPYVYLNKVIYNGSTFMWNDSENAWTNADAPPENPVDPEYVGNWLLVSLRGSDGGYTAASFAAATGVINVKEYGAIGDGSVDDTDAINAAITAIATGQTLFFPYGTYKTTAAIVVNKEVNVIMDGIIEYFGSDDIAVLTISKDSGNIIKGLRYILRASRDGASDWTDEDSISIKLVNLYQCDITIMEASDSTIGVQFMGDGAGCGYNTIKLELLNSNKYGVDCANDNGGWCNENHYLGGRFTVGSTVHTTLARYGIRIHSIDDGWPNDQNIFEKPSFEIGSTTPGVESIPVLCEKAYGCYFNYCRMEGCGSIAMRDTYMGGNYISLSSTDALDAYVDNQLSDDEALGSCVDVLYYKSRRDHVPYKIFDSGLLCERAAYYGYSTLVGIPGMVCIRRYDGEVSQSDYCDIYSDYIDCDGYIGVFVRTDVAKRFMISRERGNNAEESRVAIRPMDANMNILDGSGATEYVRWYQRTLSWRAVDSVYAFGAEYDGDFYFEFIDDVKYAFIGVRGEFRSFGLFADQWASAFSPYDRQGDPNVAMAIPTHGTYAQGKYLRNVAPASGQPKGWYCTVPGTTDTISTTCTADGTAVVVVASAADLDVGMYISIDGGAALQILEIDGTSITMSDTVGTGSGLAFVNSVPTWVSEGNL